MENVEKALILVGSALLFVIGFSYSMYLISKLSSTSKAVVETITTTSYYDSIYVEGATSDERIVGIDTVISTIYRYYKEGYSVKIIDKAGEEIQVFDLSIEDKVRRLNSLDTNSNEYDLLKKSKYCEVTSPLYMFNAPWTASNSNEDYTLMRIEYFLNGTKGYINDVLVDYSKDSDTKVFANSGGFIANYGNDAFIESFTEYAYTGESVSTSTSMETLTGDTQEKNKILITYKEYN